MRVDIAVSHLQAVYSLKETNYVFHLILVLSEGERLQCGPSCQYFLASCHLTATDCNAYTRANIPVLFLTVLCALFVLCVHMYCTLSDYTVVS